MFFFFQHCSDNTHPCQSDMNIEGAWKRGYTGKNIVVTILDDGIERTHPDLMQNYKKFSRMVCAIGMIGALSVLLMLDLMGSRASALGK
ncbi:hypothetical protein P7K49_000780, partial [Saguinus oedipus]